MKYVVMSLSDLLEEYPEDLVSLRLSRFMCSRDVGRQRFLSTQSVQMEKRSVSRTYLALDADQSILGYFTVGMKCMRVPDDAPVSRTMLKKMNVDGSTGVAQSFLLGQLGRSDVSPKGLGVSLIRDALDVFKTANRLVGCRMVHLDCAEDLVPYYLDNGFTLVNSISGDGTNQMAILI